MGGTWSSSSSSKNTKKKPGGTISDVDRAVLDLKNARDRLTRYKAKLDKDEKKLLERAKQSQLKGDKNMAVGLLRLRKYKLNEAANVENQLLSVMQMVETIQSKENEKEVVGAMKNGKDMLEAMHNEIGIDDVLQLMDEVEEQAEIENQINDILTHGGAAADDVDVEDELAALEQEVLEEEKAKVEEELPEVPTGKLPAIPDEIKDTRKEAQKEPKRVAVAS
eukprot:CAMPEP_0185732448 /NCGR_PEP_ID=MMETSP1171-20130828/16234_1 /TAXON_ID=374046 /ORGANISM="Helicotheca tamensis, Strain CCMP826" /LENGTH=221 /DNA_ID=CAMNT_0028401945 /DNA_START=34 /DNA_END=702 /DNA_ORIENTATION=-